MKPSVTSLGKLHVQHEREKQERLEREERGISANEILKGSGIVRHDSDDRDEATLISIPPLSSSSSSSKSSSSNIAPFSIMHGHEARVTAITTCIYDYSLCACSLSVDGTLCVWNLADGRCMAMQAFLLNFEPQSCATLPGKHHIAVAGSQMQIEIVDLKKLQVMKVLEGHREWIQALDAGMLRGSFNSRRFLVRNNSGSLSSDDEMSNVKSLRIESESEPQSLDAAILLSAGRDASLKYWTYRRNSVAANPASSTSQASTIGRWNPTPIISIPTEIVDPVQICHSKDWSAIVVVSEYQWDLYGFQGAKPLFSVDAPPDKHLRGAKFITNQHFLVYTDDGLALIYKIPHMDSKISIQDFLRTVQENDEILAKREALAMKQEKRKSRPSTPALGAIPLSVSTSSLDSRHSSNPPSPLPSGISSFNDEGFQTNSRNSLQDLTNSFLNVFKRKKSVDLTVDTSSTPSQQRQYDLSRQASASSLGGGSDTKPIDLSSPASSTYRQSRSVEPSPSLLSTPPPLTPMIPSGSGIALDASCEELPQKHFHYDESSIAVLGPTLIKTLDPPTTDDGDNQYLWSVSKKFIMRGDSQGVYQLWSILRDPAFPTNSEDNINIEIREHGSTSLADGWPEARTVQNPTGQAKKETRITASHFMLDKDRAPKLIHGFEDGAVSVMPSVSTEKPFTFQAHESKVTALLLCFDSQRDQRVLITGAEDATIKMWEIHPTEAKLVNTFYVHSESVTVLFSPPDSVRKRLNNGFCSIGEDGSVVLFSLKRREVIHILGGHSSEVVSVYWRPDLDYVLVRCTDGFVFVWNLSTGLLERRLAGLLSHELIEQAEGVGGSMRSCVVLGFSRKTAFIKKSRGFLESLSLVINDNEPDIQLLILSVRRTVGYINTKSKSIRHNLVNHTIDASSHALTSALGYILQYGKSNALQLLRKTLNMESPYPPAYIGLKGAGDTYSLIVPKASMKSHPFKFSPVLSALHTISCISILNALSKIPELKQVCSACRKYYLHDMPSDYDSFEDPSFLFCAQFLKDTSKEVQSAARSVMSAVLKRMPLDNAKALAEKLSNFFLDSNALMSTNARKQNVIVALAVLAYKVPKAVDGRIASITGKGLLEIMEYGGSQHTTAIALLGEGYVVWQYYVADPANLMRQLFHIALPLLSGDTVDPNTSKSLLAQAALDAFVDVANVDPKLYVDFCSEYLNNAQQSPPLMVNAVLASMEPVMRDHPACLVPHLVPITSLLLRVLDPHFPQVRKNAFTVSRKILKLLVEKYPMISFNQNKQRFAVGNVDGVIVIYDLKTASKWQHFEAHRGPITALAISHQGSLIASYCVHDYTCRLWNLDGSGILNLMGVSSRSLHVYEVSTANPEISTEEVLECVAMEWDKDQNYFTLVPGRGLQPLACPLKR